LRHSTVREEERNMGRVKDLWFREFERQYNENLDAGMSDEAAYTSAGEEAYSGVRDALEERADRLRQQKKDDALCEKVDQTKRK
jgi:hypothetical protein